MVTPSSGNQPRIDHSNKASAGASAKASDSKSNPLDRLGALEKKLKALEEKVDEDKAKVKATLQQVKNKQINQVNQLLLKKVNEALAKKGIKEE